MLRAILLIQILYTVYQGHYAVETGIPGVNLPNIIFVVALIGILAKSKPDALRDQPAMLKPAILIFFAVLLQAFVIAQFVAPGNFMVDVNYLRDALFPPLLYFMYLRCRQDVATTRLMIIAVLAVAALAGLQAVRQGFDYGIGTFVETHRASGPFGEDYRDANRAGVYYAMFLPMFIGLALFMRKQRLWRIASLAGIALLTMAILFTYSRQSYFIAIAAAVLLLTRRNVLFAVVIGIAAVALSSYLPDSVNQRVTETKQRDVHGQEVLDESTTSRWEIWSGAMAMWSHHPLGVGLNRFKTQIGNYSGYKGYDAHNFYVLTLAETGVQGLAGIVVVFFSLFRFAGFLRRRAPPEDAEARALTIGFTVMTISAALANLYGSPFLENNVFGTYWILCGTLERYIRLKSNSQEIVAAAPSLEDTMAERFPLLARTKPGLKRPRDAKS